MVINLQWSDIAIRLLCAILAAGLIDFNRGEDGHPAGLRTTILVALAACLAMLQVNLLLPTAGRPANSFVMNDLMRLPLGILSGMGFIGAGAIVRRDNFVGGITTAATVRFVTVIGLCFGRSDRPRRRQGSDRIHRVGSTEDRGRPHETRPRGQVVDFLGSIRTGRK
jgi:putative Mg2+ transporter-C (MgtC) family protein